MTVFALYYKMYCDKKELMKFFDTKEQAETYLRSVEYWGSPFDEYNTEYRENQIKEKYEIVEMPLSEVLNILLESSKELEARLDNHGGI